MKTSMKTMKIQTTVKTPKYMTNITMTADIMTIITDMIMVMTITATTTDIIINRSE